jgi:DNA polymerase alpha subunit A
MFSVPRAVRSIEEYDGPILNDILSRDDTEVAVQRIAAKMREGTIPIQKYIIFTQLAKGPKEYPNADSMPQVQIALRGLARGKVAYDGPAPH